MQPTFPRVAELGRRMKADAVRKDGWRSDPTKCDLSPFVLVARAGRLFATVHPMPGLDGVRNACYAAAACLQPDELFCILDSRMRQVSEGENPDHVHQGDLERAWKRGERRGIVEALVIVRATREDVDLIVYPYERRVQRLTWLEPKEMPEELSGAVVDYIRAGFAAAPGNWAETLKVAALAERDLEDLYDERLTEPERDRAILRAMATHLTGLAFSAVSLLDEGDE